MAGETVIEETPQVNSRIPTTEQFKALSRVVMRDLNKIHDTPTFHRYNKQDILKFLQDPCKNEKKLRDACIDIYGASSQFRRLIQYFVSLTDLSYVVTPITTSFVSESAARKNLNKTLKMVEAFQPKSQFRKIITVCMREDVFYGTLRETTDNITIQQLPSDYCKISAIEGNVFNVTFDFSYFDSHSYNLPLYSQEFRLKYGVYKADRNNRWQELDSPTSFAIKCTSDIGAYALPPFAGILPQVYDLDAYKAMKLTRTEMENYAILVMKLGINSDGTWQMDFDKAVDFWSNLDHVLPESVGSVLSPMSVDKISFDRTTNPESTAISEATNTFYSSAGVSPLLFSGDKASSNALLLSIKADQDVTYGIVLSIQDAVNRYIQSKAYGKNFKVTFLNTSTFNRDETADQYLKMVNLGMPMVSFVAATYGMSQTDMENMNYLEDTLLGIKEKFIPLSTSNTISPTVGEETGRPQGDAEDISDSTETWREGTGDG